jgi:hypothetical protein
MPIPAQFVSQTGVGASEDIKIQDTNDFRVAYAVAVVGTVTYTVQHTLDGVTWFDNSDTKNQTVPKDGNYVLPVAAVRVNVTAGTGTATLHVRQLIV